MKSEGAIKHKIKQVRFRLTEKALRNARSKRPCNCKHSGLVRGVAGDEMFYVCLLDSDRPKDWDGTICDPSIPPKCPYFEPEKTRERIEEEIWQVLNSGDIGKIASHYPDLAALLWVLEGIDSEPIEDQPNLIDWATDMEEADAVSSRNHPDKDAKKR